MLKLMKRALKVKLKPRADRDLSEIYQYSLKKFGKQVVIKYIKDIDSAFINIANNLKSG